MKAIKNFICSNWPFLVGLIIYAALAWVYFKNFGKFPISKENEHWGQLGDFIGGLANPFFTLLTVLLFIKSLEQNKNAIELSTEELKLTRKEMLHNKTLQTMTKNALDSQIDIARSESDLNNARSFINNYRVVISELHKRYHTEATGVMSQEKYKLQAEISAQIEMYKHKIEETESLINALYDDLIDRLNIRAGIPNIQNYFHENHEVIIKCMADFSIVLAIITTPDETEKILAFTYKMDKNDTLAEWRQKAKIFGTEQSKKSIELYMKTGYWLESDYKYHSQNND